VKLAPPTEKVPQEAQMVYDNEKLAKEILDLKRRLKELYTQNHDLSRHIKSQDGKKLK
jgi:uncharacterized protein with PhoU and TrkA domain